MLIYPQPVVIQRVQVVQPVQPIYLHVPPGHAKDWKKHCQKYDACARPVYFVKDDWYNNVYVPHYEQEHGKGKGKGNGNGVAGKGTRQGQGLTARPGDHRSRRRPPSRSCFGCPSRSCFPADLPSP